jgi:flagellar biosynthetic protein FlhB
LARALFRHSDVGDEIPAALYSVVAELLAYVYQLRRLGERRVPQPEFAVPAGLDRGAVA